MGLAKFLWILILPFFSSCFCLSLSFFITWSQKRIKLVVGIAGSLLFYAWGNLNYVPLMVGLTLFAYLLAQGN